MQTINIPIDVTQINEEIHRELIKQLEIQEKEITILQKKLDKKIKELEALESKIKWADMTWDIVKDIVHAHPESVDFFYHNN